MAGYELLIERFRLDAIPIWHRSRIAAGNSPSQTHDAHGIEQVYRNAAWPGDTACDHLEFALKYELDDDGRMTVSSTLGRWYRYPDLTAQTEALIRFVNRAIDVEFANELEFIERYDEARAAVREVVDLPDRKLDLLLRLLGQNDFRLSRGKRTTHFAELTDDEVRSDRVGRTRPFPERINVARGRGLSGLPMVSSQLTDHLPRRAHVLRSGAP